MRTATPALMTALLAQRPRGTSGRYWDWDQESSEAKKARREKRKAQRQARKKARR